MGLQILCFMPWAIPRTGSFFKNILPFCASHSLVAPVTNSGSRTMSLVRIAQILLPILAQM